MRNPLGRLLGLVVVVVALTAGAVGLTSCGGGDDSESAQPADTGGSAPAGQGDATAGKEVYLSAGCGSCHTLADAGTSGSAGPNLDDVQPSFEQVKDQVENGGGGMPAFGDSLSEKQIADVSAYVSSSAGS